MDEFVIIRLKLDEAITYGSHEQARELAEKGLTLAVQNGNEGEAEYFIGQLEILKENFRLAIHHFDLAIKHNPHDGAAYNDRALCMVELGIIDDSFEYFDKGIEVESDYATIHHNKGWLLNQIGRYTEAIKCFQRALELESNRPVTYENLADALANLGRYTESIDAYKKALECLHPSCHNIQKQIIRQMEEVQKKLGDKSA